MRTQSLLALLALPVLAACTYVQDPSQVEANIIAPGNFRTGSGAIESVAVLPGARPKDSRVPAAPPGRVPDPNLYRLFLQMDNGGTQAVDIDNGTFMPGEKVELTNDGRVVRVTGTSLMKAVGGR